MLDFVKKPLDQSQITSSFENNCLTKRYVGWAKIDINTTLLPNVKIAKDPWIMSPFNWIIYLFFMFGLPTVAPAYWFKVIRKEKLIEFANTGDGARLGF